MTKNGRAVQGQRVGESGLDFESGHQFGRGHSVFITPAIRALNGKARIKLEWSPVGEPMLRREML